jgi:stage III sporulation protein SpoIIIAA
MADIDALLALIPRWIAAAVPPRDPADLEEIIVDLGQPPRLRFVDGTAVSVAMREVRSDDIQYIIGRVTRFREDNRTGIDRTLHRIACVRDRYHEIVGFTFRVGRAIGGAAEPIADLLGEGHHILLVGPPGAGKTTVLRSAAALLADRVGRRVVIADTSNEIGGDGRVAHPGIGKARRLQIPLFDPSQPTTLGERQAQLVLQAVVNHSAESLIVDEIGFESDARIVRTMARRGVQLVATAHGRRLNDVVFNPDLASLIGYPRPLVLRSDEAARSRTGRHTILERTESPVFDRVVELVRRDFFAVHGDVAASVDAILSGLTPAVEIRRRKEQDINNSTAEEAWIESPNAASPWNAEP